jgi:putative ABC transport system substrate-binding protein
MRRREFVGVLAAAAWPLGVRAQQAGKVYRVGVLLPGAPSASTSRINAVRQGLGDLGYSEGQNLVIVAKGSEAGSPAQLRSLAEDLVRDKVDIIVTAGGSTTQAAKSAAGAIPVVMTFVGDPVGSGFVASLARPGGNITGFTNFGPEMGRKWLELIKELSPKASRIGILYDSAVRYLVSDIEQTAKTVDVELHRVEVNSADESAKSRRRSSPAPTK